MHIFLLVIYTVTVENSKMNFNDSVEFEINCLKRAPKEFISVHTHDSKVKACF